MGGLALIATGDRARIDLCKDTGVVTGTYPVQWEMTRRAPKRRDRHFNVRYT